jgi:hypothetical protein
VNAYGSGTHSWRLDDVAMKLLLITIVSYYSE